jgi:O-antigen/teichoic acid export membrane protein
MIKKILYKLADKKSFSYMAYKVIQSSLFSSGLMFASSIIIIRHLPKEDYGLYVLMMAYFAIFELFMGGFDASLVRFIPTSGKLKQHKLIATILSIKTVITVAILFAFYFLYDYSYQWLNIPVNKLNEYTELYIIISISFIFRYISTTIGTLLASFMMYDLSFKLSVISGVLTLLNSIFIWEFSYGIVEYVLIATIISFIFALLNIYYLYYSKNLSFQKVISSINFIDIKYTFISQVWSYSTPLLGVSLFSYIKNYLPTYLFGTMVSLETLAVYSIFKKITDFLHKGYSGFIQSLYPKLFKIIHSKSNAIDKLFWIGLGLRIAAFVALYFGYDLILSLYDIKESDLDKLIFVTLACSFLIYYFGTFATINVLSKKTTTEILYSSLFLGIISLVLLQIGYYLFGVLGIIFGDFIAKLLGVSLVVYYSKINKDNRVRISYYSIVIFSIIILGVVV